MHGEDGMRRVRLLLSLVIVGCMIGCGQLEPPALDNPLENASLPVPTALRATIGDGRVELAWDAVTATPVDGYRVFRRVAGAASYHPLADVTATAYSDVSVQNGRDYEYAVAVLGSGGRIGRRSSPVTVAPNLFGILLEDGRARTASRTVQAALAFPSGTAYMMLANQVDFSDGSWESARSSRSWSLLPDDGAKRVYVKFRDATGSESAPVSDALELDTVAEVRALTFTAPDPIVLGSIVHLRLETNERDGTATVRFGTSLTGIELRDDGTLGDPTADDGIFERDLSVDAGMNVRGEPATGTYTDGAGNVSPEFTTTQTLSIAFAPLAVTLGSVTPDGRARLELQWLESTDPNFVEYRVVRSLDGAVDSLDVVVGTLSNRSSRSFPDTNLREGQTFYYRVFVRARNGLEAGSNVVAGTVTDMVPVVPVLHAPLNVGPTAMTLRWDISPVTDFLRYRVYRATVPGVNSATGTLVFEGTLQDVNFYNDYGLATGTTYYYVLVVEDLGLKTNQSLEITATTL
jgi:fibronectin type 3 domain-containing protein